MIRPTPMEMTIYRPPKKNPKKMSKNLKKGVDKQARRWYYSQAVRRESDTDSR